jgi:hypothetical protein
MQCLPGSCQRCGAVFFSAYAFSAHQGDLIGSPCLSPERMRAMGMVRKRGLWYVSRYEADHFPLRRRCIPLPGDTIDFWHYRLERNPLWREEEWAGTEGRLAEKWTFSWHIVHATVVEVSYYGAMVTFEADHPSFGPGWRRYGPFEGLDLVRPGETPERRRQIYEGWLYLRRLGLDVREDDLVFTDPERESPTSDVSRKE